MGRYVADFPFRLAAINTRLALCVACAALLLCPACSGKTGTSPALDSPSAGGTGGPPVDSDTLDADGPAVPTTPTDPAAPIPAGEVPPDLLAQLRQSLSAEFARLGVDPEKVAAAAPQSADNAVFDLSATIIDPDGPPDGEGGGELPPTGVELTWTERMTGDYDQNGEVNYSDITPLGLHFNSLVDYDDPGIHGGFEAWPTGDPADTGATSPPDPSSGAANWRMARIDGDSNGELNFGDVTPLAVHWQERLSGYLIERAINYGTGELNWEPAPLDIGYGSQPSAPRSELAYYEPSTPVRYTATVPLTDPDFTTYFRVRPFDANSETSGEPSNVASYNRSPGMDTTPPYWTDAVGLQRLLPYVEQITVGFGTATDDDSPPVSYRVYWAEGDAGDPEAPFDYETAQTADVSESPYVITGLTDGQYYRVAVRARDSAPVPNEERNAVLMGAVPGPRDIYPPEWQGRVGLAELYYGNGVAVVAWDKAQDDYSDDYGSWESGPVIYKLYEGIGSQTDFSNCSVHTYEDIGLDHYVVILRELDTSADRWFMLTVSDQAEFPNENTGGAALLGTGTTLAEIEAPHATIGETEIDTGIGDYVLNADLTVAKAVAVNELEIAEGQLQTWVTTWKYTDSGFQLETQDPINTGAVHYYPYYTGLSSEGDTQIVFGSGGIGSEALQVYSQGEGIVQSVSLSPNGLHSIAGLNNAGSIWAALYTEDLSHFPQEIYFDYFFSIGVPLNPRHYLSGTQDSYLANRRDTATLADGSIAWAASELPAYTSFIVQASSENITITPYIPSSPGCTMTEAVYGIDVPRPIVAENCEVDPDNSWWKATDGIDQLVANEQAPLDRSNPKWGIINMQHACISTLVTTEYLYVSPGEESSFQLAEVWLDTDHLLIPYGELINAEQKNPSTTTVFSNSSAGFEFGSQFVVGERRLLVLTLSSH